jgi:C-terminal processing protease CtpA/Prc
MTEKYPTVGVHAPSENHFDGRLYVLIDGGSFSASADFSATVDVYKRATFIGEETGGAAACGAAGGDATRHSSSRAS